MPSNPPQASLELDLAADDVARGTPMPVPATSTQMVAELCTFREDVHGLRRDQRGMTDRLIEGQVEVANRLDSVIGLLERQTELLDRQGSSQTHLSDQLGLLGGAILQMLSALQRRIEQSDAP